jgi:hypothetical protein
MADKNYTGVRWISETQNWQSKVSSDGIVYNCGNHVEQLDAVRARDTKIIEKGLNKPLQILKPLKKVKS